MGLLDPLSSDDVPLAGAVLLQNAPNPFNPATTIAFVLGRTGAVRLEIFNARGQLIRVLVEENLPACAHSVVWNGETDGGQHAASGTYFYRLNANDEVLTMKMSLVKQGRSRSSAQSGCRSLGDWQPCFSNLYRQFRPDSC